MTEKISQIYEEEQINKVRNDRKAVPDNKMPDLQWNLEKQREEEEINKIEMVKQPTNRVQETIISTILFVYSILLSLQDLTTTTAELVQ